ncbi:MAG: EAL domain-containing protein [Nitrospiraceae bacterium]|nr:MAG: EAL domain-containing protein [Nitrospiraceae bacterium]
MLNLYVIFHSLTNLLTDNAQVEAIRLGNHLSGMLIRNDEELTHAHVSEVMSLHGHSLLHDFQLMKLKVFSPTGEILYSTSKEDIGTFNKESNFHAIVARGNSYTSVVKKDAPSREGQTVKADVVETYVPIMQGDRFLGAFEIYYDISTRNQALHDFIVRSSMVILMVMTAFLVTIVFLIVRSEGKTENPYLGGLPRRYSSPFYLIFLITAAIFITDTAVMIITGAFPHLTLITKALFDATLLVLFVSPVLYFFMLRPLLLHIKELGLAQAQISRMSLYDELTNLPNRSLFQDRLRQALAHAERYEGKVGVLFLDLDNFKRVNDIFEHRRGDTILKEIAGRLTSSLRSSDSVARQQEDESMPTIARMGGDEFTILLSQLRSSQDAIRVAKRIISVMATPFIVNSQELFISASIGIAISPVDGKDVDILIKNAHAAMYHAKKKGRNNYQFYEGSMNSTAYRRLILENDLRRAIDSEEFTLYYQPRIDIRSGRVVALEALIRWLKPGGAVISPMEFIPVAEESGLIIPIGEWVLRNACEQMKAWHDDGMQDLCVSVNISGHQFQKENLAATLSRTLAAVQLDPKRVELEITESIMMKGGEDALSILQALKEMGVNLAMDDFGTGYSSFSYLRQFPLDTIKIDKSFIRDVTSSKDTKAIVEAIIAMAHRLQLTTVAEGVEQEDQLEFLRRKGCDEIQGYLMSPPVPPKEIPALLGQLSGKAGVKP